MTQLPLRQIFVKRSRIDRRRNRGSRTRRQLSGAHRSHARRRRKPPIRAAAASPSPFFLLRSLPVRRAEIPQRFSSSSLPPSFAAGRCATACISQPRRPPAAAPRAPARMTARCAASPSSAPASPGCRSPRTWLRGRTWRSHAVRGRPTISAATPTPSTSTLGRPGPSRHGVDTGFLVFNERTYPRLIGCSTSSASRPAASDMSFSVQAARASTSNGAAPTSNARLRAAAQPAAAGASCACWPTSCASTACAPRSPTRRDEAALQQPIGDFLDAHRFGATFRDWYFLPMIGCIWSCPTDQMLRFPIATMIRFCHNHGLLQIADRPQWYTVARRRAPLCRADAGVGIADARLNTPVRAVRRLPPARRRRRRGVLVAHRPRQRAFRRGRAGLPQRPVAGAAGRCRRRDERAVLGAIRYHPNRAVLHTDAGVLPRRRRAWAAWNYERAGDAAREHGAVCLHYLINRLQPLPFEQPVIVSLNPLARARRRAWCRASSTTRIRCSTRRRSHAQRALPALQGVATPGSAAPGRATASTRTA